MGDRHTWRRATFAWLAAAVALAGCSDPFAASRPAETKVREVRGWTAYGGPGGSHFSDLTQLDRSNVAQLEVAWVFRTGDVGTVFQSTPIVAAGQLVACTPHNEVVALDPLTGGQLWHFDPQVARRNDYANEANCRGVAHWRDAAAPQSACGERIVMATNDARLMAIDARTGKPCAGFGKGGSVDLAAGVGRVEWAGEYQVTSPPTVVGDVIVVGSAVSDGSRVDAPSGVVRAYDARSGALRWAFDLAPPGFDHARDPVSDAGYALGTPNVWAPMSADAARDLVFLPTGNPAPDYYRQGPLDMDFYGSSVLALRASTGELVWQFRTVVNDFWDFDVPSQPVLVDLELQGRTVPALIQGTKMGFVFVLDRLTGKPMVPVTQQPVPRQGPLASALSPTQPFPPPAFRVSREYKAGGSVLGLCDGLEAESVIGPVYTPITEQWTIGLPSNMGATNWGGVAVDARRGRIAVPTSSVPFRTRLIARAKVADLLAILQDDKASEVARVEARAALFERIGLDEDVEVAQQRGTDYLMARHPFLDPLVGLPCAGTPLGEILMIDIAGERQVWRHPHGTTRDVTLLPLATGMPGMGGPMLTASGLLFIGGGAERALRAYDADTGEELWHHRLPEPGNATPMSYEVMTADGPRQFVVIAAGGDARGGIAGTSDHLVAFALPVARP